MKTRLIAALLSLPLWAHAAPVNLVTNGDFEATAQANRTWNLYGTLPGWRLVGGGGSGTAFELRNDVAGTAASGRNYIELDANGNTTIEQVFADLNDGGNYLLSFAYSPRAGKGADTNGLVVLWNGQALGPVITGVGAAGNRWSTHSFVVKAIGRNDSLRFAGVGTSDSYGASLDNVVVNDVPEPASLALVGLAGFVGWGVRRRRA